MPRVSRHADDDPYMLKNEGHVSTQFNNGSSNPTVDVVQYKLQERHERRVDHLYVVNVMNENFLTDWQIGELSLW